VCDDISDGYDVAQLVVCGIESNPGPLLPPSETEAVVGALTTRFEVRALRQNRSLQWENGRCHDGFCADHSLLLVFSLSCFGSIQTWDINTNAV